MTHHQTTNSFFLSNQTISNPAHQFQDILSLLITMSFPKARKNRTRNNASIPSRRKREDVVANDISSITNIAKQMKNDMNLKINA